MTRPSLGASRLIEANMRRWLEREKLDQRIAEQAHPARLGPYIVISRQCGARGAEIAELLSKTIAWELIDREIVEAIAKDFNVSKQLVEFVDERHVAWLTEIFEAWIGRQDFCQEGYVHDLTKLLMIAAQHGKIVIIGRGSQFILPREFGLFVNLRAPLKCRIANIMRSKGLSESAAKKLIIDTDQQRAGFLKSYFQKDGTDPDLYDLIIDTSRFSAEGAVQLIQAAAKLRQDDG